MRLNNGKSPPVVRQFLIDQLRHNDNRTNLVRYLTMIYTDCTDELFQYNKYSDGWYIATVISSLATACVSTVAPERGEFLPTQAHSDQNGEDRELLKVAQAEVERYRSMDRLVPSPHNVVTVAALEVFVWWFFSID